MHLIKSFFTIIKMDRQPYIRANIPPSKRKKETDPSGWFVIALVIVVLTVIFAIVIYLFYVDIKAPQVIQRCNPGLCKFSIFTGVKTCPGVGDPVGVQLLPGTEWCTSANFCQKEGFTCAVQADQSVSCDGICDTPQCRCIANPNNGFV